MDRRMVSGAARWRATSGTGRRDAHGRPRFERRPIAARLCAGAARRGYARASSWVEDPMKTATPFSAVRPDAARFGSRPALRAGLATVITILLVACTQSMKLTKDDSPVVLAGLAIQAPNPGEPGPMKVQTLFYGSGKDKRRAEYRDSVRIKTKSVDGSAFVKMEPAEERTRRSHWGFDAKSYPLNGRVWYPEGPGPFPLVLVVHGN